ncbi:gamma-glutamyl peptidase 5-like [Aristolochia californica]|uniref:gamma-glutamyl peptidase 5-like n=1 Tax=Aristolochia californica TaxID=171875 RepID=UPI0035DE7A4A
MKRFAVLLCAEDSEYVKKKYGGYFEVFVGMLGEDGETWDRYRVANGEFPDEKEIDLYDGFVITGSCNDAHGNDVWILKLLALLKKLHSKKKKILGVCFGHQILSRAIGGKTGRAITGWDIGTRTISIYPTKLLSKLQIPSQLSVIEFHRDEVKELPPFVDVIARSEKTGIEMFMCGDHAMGIQGHPEYNEGILIHLIDRLQARYAIDDSLAEAAKASFEKGEPDKETWKKLCRGFLKGTLVL